LIWASHIGFDRKLGYGLKYRAACGATHGHQGKARPMTESAATPRAGLIPRMNRWTLVRVLIPATALVATFIGAGQLLGLLVPPNSSPWHVAAAMARNLVVIGLLLSVYTGLVRWREHRRASELSPAPGAIQLPAGALIGVALMAGVFLILSGLGLGVLSKGDGLPNLPAAIIATAVSAVFEELLLRGVLFRIVEDAHGTTMGLIVSAAVFGLLHGLNPGATLFSDAAIAIEAGLLLALAYAVTRNLWFPIGLHLGWNFTEGDLIGVPVSGGSATHSIFRAVLHGPDLLTGGAFGPEASAITIGVCLVLSLVFGALVIRRSGWRAARNRAAS
jgi:membrane protease YdiL (CAAX protease family)